MVGVEGLQGRDIPLPESPGVVGPAVVKVCFVSVCAIGSGSRRGIVLGRFAHFVWGALGEGSQTPARRLG